MVIPMIDKILGKLRMELNVKQAKGLSKRIALPETLAYIGKH